MAIPSEHIATIRGPGARNGMVSSNGWTPVTILLRKHLGLLALAPFLLWSCQADDPTAHGVMTEPGVLASGYWIPDGIAVIGEGESLFADRGGAL